MKRQANGTSRGVAVAVGAAWVISAHAATAQSSPCGEGVARARVLADRLQMAEAERALADEARRGCVVGVASTYLRGLRLAREASAKGGDPESLAPVRRAVAELDGMGDVGGPAEIASLVLRAATAAAQSEREEMAVVLAQALQVERARGARGAEGAPVISAHQMAGDLWLQVHRYDEAAAAFRVAQGVAGESPRVAVGLARALARDGRVEDACVAYRTVARLARANRTALRAEAAEAREFLGKPQCRPAVRP